jgi:hypothetical protein
MLHQNINNLFEAAKNGLTASEEELNRPIEDVVVLSACHSTRGAIRKMLTAMISHNYTITYKKRLDVDQKLEQLQKWDLMQLIQKSGKIYPAIGKLDYSVLACHADPESKAPNYCLSEEKVCECTKLGRKIETLVNRYIEKQEIIAKIEATHNTKF